MVFLVENNQIQIDFIKAKVFDSSLPFIYEKY